MSRTTQEKNSVLKDNWYLIAATVVLLGGGIVMAFVSGGGEEESTGGTTAAASSGSKVQVVEGDQGAIDPNAAAPSDVDQIRGYIDDYEKQIQDHPGDPQNAMRMFNRANLLHQIHETEESIIGYEEFIKEFPDDMNVRAALIMLPRLYEEANDQRMVRATYQRWLDYFPEDSQEHQYALEQLNH